MPVGRVMDSWFKTRRESKMSNSTVDSGYAGSVGSANGLGNQESPTVQMHGIMQKKPFGHQSTKWSRRFFVLKEGFLLYYGEAEKKVYDAKRQFNIHPKGCIPLGNCLIEDLTLPGMPYCINIDNPQLKMQVCVAADDDESRKRWIKAMDKATKVTMANAGLSEAMIKSLQEQSLQLARERQEYVDKFITEAEELGAERELREALEEFNQELEDENAKIEDMVQELKRAHKEVKDELSDAIESSRRLEREREEMRSKTVTLQSNLEALSSERAEIIEKLKDHEARKENSTENNAELAQQLASIEEKAILLEKDREEIRKKLEENQRMSKDLLQEREAISLEAEELKSEIQNLSEEKKVAERNLKEEMVARMELQKELKECKAALRRLEVKALSLNNPNSSENPSLKDSSSDSFEKSQTSDEEDSNEQIIRDVKSLREFFENCARENNKVEDGSPSHVQRKGSSDNAEDHDPKKSSPVKSSAGTPRGISRATVIRRKTAQSTRCKSMVFDEEFSVSSLVRDPNHRRSLLLSRHKRSMSLSKKLSISKKQEV